MTKENIFEVWDKDKIDELLEEVLDEKSKLLFHIVDRIKLKQIVKEATDGAYKQDKGNAQIHYEQGIEQGKKAINYSVSEWREIGKRLKYWEYFEKEIRETIKFIQGQEREKIIKKIEELSTTYAIRNQGFPDEGNYINKQDVINIIKKV